MTLQNLYDDIDFQCNVTTAEYSPADRDRNINNWDNFCVAEILDSMDDWDFHGEIATANLSANQQEYIFPTDILKIKRIEIDYDGDGAYGIVDLIDSATIDSSIATSAQINNAFGAGDPKYDAYNESLFLFPVPDTDVTNGLKIWYSKNVTQLTGTAAGLTAEPVIKKPFQKILSLGASLDYGRKYQIEELIRNCERELYGRVATRRGLIGGLIDKMKKFYSTRTKDAILGFRSKYFDINYK